MKASLELNEKNEWRVFMNDHMIASGKLTGEPFKARKVATYRGEVTSMLVTPDGRIENPAWNRDHRSPRWLKDPEISGWEIRWQTPEEQAVNALAVAMANVNVNSQIR